MRALSAYLTAGVSPSSRGTTVWSRRESNPLSRRFHGGFPERHAYRPLYACETRPIGRTTASVEHPGIRPGLAACKAAVIAVDQCPMRLSRGGWVRTTSAPCLAARPLSLGVRPCKFQRLLSVHLRDCSHAHLRVAGPPSRAGGIGWSPRWDSNPRSLACRASDLAADLRGGGRSLPAGKPSDFPVGCLQWSGFPRCTSYLSFRLLR